MLITISFISYIKLNKYVILYIWQETAIMLIGKLNDVMICYTTSSLADPGGGAHPARAPPLTAADL